MNILKNRNIIIVLLLLIGIPLVAQETDTDTEIENDFEYRSSFKFSYKPIKKLKINFTPEVRFKDNFTVDNYLLETELVYKPFKHFYVGGNYRFVINPRTQKTTEYLHRFGVTTTYKRKFDRFEPQVRLSYTNYADDDDVDDNFLRYKAALGYDIKKCKLTPTISAELFHQLADNEMYKVRYKLALDYKIFKNNYVGASYRLDYYLKKYENNHIFSIGYKLKF